MSQVRCLALGFIVSLWLVSPARTCNSMSREMRGFSFREWQGRQQDFDTQSTKDKYGEVLKLNFSGSHSNILRIDDSRMLKSLQTCDKSWGCSREAKPIHTNQLTRFIARTPCCKQLFGELWDQSRISHGMCLHPLLKTSHELRHVNDDFPIVQRCIKMMTLIFC